MTIPDCPTPQQLAALLSGRLSTDVESSLAAHLDACERCRQWLERLASDPRFLAEAAAILRGTSDDTVPLPPAELVARWADLDGIASLDGLADLAGPEFGATPVVPPRSGAARQVGRETAAQAAPTARRSGAAPETRAFYPEPVPGEFPRPGQRLGLYELEKEVGRGGMGVVFLARDTSLERPVALKVLGQHWIRDDVARQRFLSEARAAAAVNHRHVVTIYAVVESGEWPYLVMEYVPGDTLQQLIDAHAPLPLASILSIGQRVAAGLAAAHAKGLIHRDVKPGNILVVPRTGVVKLTDFGLARAASDARITKDGLVVGTPAFMAPEQISGESLDPRADLYSFGGVLHAMCTGRPPIEAEHTIALIRRVLDAPRKPLAESCPHLPTWFAQLVDRLLARRPDDRPQSAQEVVELLRRQREELADEPSGRASPEPSRPLESALAANASDGAREACEPPTVTLAAASRQDTAIVAPPTLVDPPASSLPLATASPITPSAVPLLAPPLPPRVRVARPPRRSLAAIYVTLSALVLLVALGGYGVWEWSQARDAGATSSGDGARIVAKPRGPRGASHANPGKPRDTSGGRELLGGGELFVEIAEAGPERRRHATLADAVRAALAGETLVVHGSGVLTSEPLVIAQKPLAIRAAPGEQPVVQFVAGTQHGGFMIESDAPLVLEGLTLLAIGDGVGLARGGQANAPNFGPVGPRPGGPKFGGPPEGGGMNQRPFGAPIPGEGLIAFRNTTLTLRRCRLATWRRGPVVTLDRAQQCAIAECQLSGGDASVVVCRDSVPDAGRSSSLHVEDSLISGAAGITFDVHPDAAWSFETRRTDYLSDEALRIEIPDSNPPGDGRPRARVVVEQCTFGGRFALGFWTRSPQDSPLQRAAAARRLPDFLRWEGRDNTFADGIDFLSVRSMLRQNPPAPAQLVGSLDAWRRFWGAEEPNSRQTPLVYGPDRLPREEALRRAKERPAGADFVQMQLRAADLPDERLVRPAR